jgi:hypothetical protein
MRVLLGYCKECGARIYEDDIIEGRELYECNICMHPHTKDEIWKERPDYFKVEKFRLSKELAAEFPLEDCEYTIIYCNTLAVVEWEEDGEIFDVMYELNEVEKHFKELAWIRL